MRKDIKWHLSYYEFLEKFLNFVGVLLSIKLFHIIKDLLSIFSGISIELLFLHFPSSPMHSNQEAINACSHKDNFLYKKKIYYYIYKKFKSMHSNQEAINMWVFTSLFWLHALFKILSLQNKFIVTIEML